MPEVTGRQLLIHDLANRLETAPGTLAWDPLGTDYGYDVRALMNSKQRDLNGITRRIASECEKDDRVESAEVVAEWTAENSIRIDIEIEDGDGPFPFTLLVSALTVSIINQGP